ncbi:Uncharacterized protein BP5553_01765 [Venustampulla echinocandica]|uniref:Uncharacterized protein n=1 Tax=Venustampulla echinocandica TaxID=2656787 RepID=A0A370U1Y3_9HELO|nr:Uncharacterized protein BP5553_01765 [Venustampulla echinocandica]RDL41786.1 Uncharacterized protein BP5553_01765 [Venustampulla echinocandica]
MSSILSFGMSSSKKEKHSPNSRARRHSAVSSHSKKSKKDKDTTDSESVSSGSSGDTIVVPPGLKKCPLRFMLAGMLEVEKDGKPKTPGCPLRRVQLWHTIPLVLLAIINLLLVIIALLGLAGYRIAMGLQGLVFRIAKNDFDYRPYSESENLIDTSDVPAPKKKR